EPCVCVCVCVCVCLASLLWSFYVFLLLFLSLAQSYWRGSDLTKQTPRNVCVCVSVYACAGEPSSFHCYWPGNHVWQLGGCLQPHTVSGGGRANLWESLYHSHT